MVVTTQAAGAIGAPAQVFKSTELADTSARGFGLGFGFGNQATDAEAYLNAGIEPASNRILIQFTDATHGSRRIESYGELLGEFGGLPPVCQ